MRLRIRHETTHRYDSAPAAYAQLIRLTPSDSAAQRVIAWRVCDERQREPLNFIDGFGNASHFLSRKANGREVRIVAEGEVATSAIDELAGAEDALPPRLFLRATPLTAPDAGIAALARAARARAGEGVGPEAELHALLQEVCERIAHTASATCVTTPAAEALAGGAGVCQDRAHVFLAAARLLGHPARYVSGYQHGAAENDGAMHAWAEAFVPGRGWLALDPSSGARAGLAHVRIAIGLDYNDAAPLRGVRSGGAREQLAVAVQVQEMQQQ